MFLFFLLGGGGQVEGRGEDRLHEVFVPKKLPEQPKTHTDIKNFISFHQLKELNPACGERPFEAEKKGYKKNRLSQSPFLLLVARLRSSLKSTWQNIWTQTTLPLNDGQAVMQLPQALLTVLRTLFITSFVNSRSRSTDTLLSILRDLR